MLFRYNESKCCVTSDASREKLESTKLDDSRAVFFCLLVALSVIFLSHLEFRLHASSSIIAEWVPSNGEHHYTIPSEVVENADERLSHFIVRRVNSGWMEDSKARNFGKHFYAQMSSQTNWKCWVHKRGEEKLQRTQIGGNCAPHNGVEYFLVAKIWIGGCMGDECPIVVRHVISCWNTHWNSDVNACLYAQVNRCVNETCCKLGSWAKLVLWWVRENHP